MHRRGVRWISGRSLAAEHVGCRPSICDGARAAILESALEANPEQRRSAREASQGLAIQAP